MMTPNSDGPDISHHNPVADWGQIPQYRLFIAKATEGKSFRSPTFDENWVQMRRRGFEFRGAYHWIRSDSSMLEQVNNLARALDGHGGLQVGEFVMLDWETTPNVLNVSIDQVELWLDLANRRWPGRVMVYSSDWVPGFAEWRAANPHVALCYANYNTGNKPTSGPAECAKWNADVWQWSSSQPVPGIADPTVDMNHVWEWNTLKAITAQLEEPDMPREYIAVPPPERPGMPWFLKIDGVVSYATAGDDGYPAITLNTEQYDWLYRSVMGRDTVPVTVTNFPPPVAPIIGPVTSTGSFTINGTIDPVQ